MLARPPPHPRAAGLLLLCPSLALFSLKRSRQLLGYLEHSLLPPPAAKRLWHPFISSFPSWMLPSSQKLSVCFTVCCPLGHLLPGTRLQTPPLELSHSRGQLFPTEGSKSLSIFCLFLRWARLALNSSLLPKPKQREQPKACLCHCDQYSRCPSVYLSLLYCAPLSFRMLVLRHNTIEIKLLQVM